MWSLIEIGTPKNEPKLASLPFDFKSCASLVFAILIASS
jgi:hypothetical protein